jgi:hypothetical protein
MDETNDSVTFEGTKVGEVTHFFDKISVAVIKPDADFSIGDKVKIYDKEGNVVVEQEVSSMQIDGKEQSTVPSGTEFGMKVEGEVKEGFGVYQQ